jgi:hypothetical protein
MWFFESNSCHLGFLKFVFKWFLKFVTVIITKKGFKLVPQKGSFCKILTFFFIILKIKYIVLRDKQLFINCCFFGIVKINVF